MQTMPRPVLFISDILEFVISFFLPVVIFFLSLLTKIFYWARLTTQPSVANGARQYQAFQFGFMREQIIGGWPSSHTTIVFALAVSLCMILPKHKKLKVYIFLIALFVGLGVTFGFHWFSEFIAGAILGIVVGNIVGRHFRE